MTSKSYIIPLKIGHRSSAKQLSPSNDTNSVWNEQFLLPWNGLDILKITVINHSNNGTDKDNERSDQMAPGMLVDLNSIDLGVTQQFCASLRMIDHSNNIRQAYKSHGSLQFNLTLKVIYNTLIHMFSYTRNYVRMPFIL